MGAPRYFFHFCRQLYKWCRLSPNYLLDSQFFLVPKVAYCSMKAATWWLDSNGRKPDDLFSTFFTKYVHFLRNFDGWLPFCWNGTLAYAFLTTYLLFYMNLKIRIFLQIFYVFYTLFLEN